MFTRLVTETKKTIEIVDDVNKMHAVKQVRSRLLEEWLISRQQQEKEVIRRSFQLTKKRATFCLKDRIPRMRASVDPEEPRSTFKIFSCRQQQGNVSVLGAGPDPGSLAFVLSNPGLHRLDFDSLTFPDTFTTTATTTPCPLRHIYCLTPARESFLVSTLSTLTTIRHLDIECADYYLLINMGTLLPTLESFVHSGQAGFNYETLASSAPHSNLRSLAITKGSISHLQLHSIALMFPALRNLSVYRSNIEWAPIHRASLLSNTARCIHFRFGKHMTLLPSTSHGFGFPTSGR